MSPYLTVAAGVQEALGVVPPGAARPEGTGVCLPLPEVTR